MTFTATTANCSSPSFNWNFGNAKTGSGNPATATYTDAGGSFTVNVTATDTNNLIATMSHTVAVTPRLLVASVTGTPNPTEVGIPVNFSAKGSGGVGSQIFSWNFGDSSPGGSGNTTSHTYTTSGTRTVKVTVTDGNGVTATKTVSVVVNARLAVTVGAIPNPATAGQTVSFNAGITGGVSPVSCTWTFGDNATATGCTLIHNYSVSGTFTVNMTAVDYLAVTATRSVSVTVNPACTVDFVWSPTSPEGGQTVLFTATTANCVSVSLAWDLGNGDAASGHHGDTIYPNAGGTFTVNITVTGGGSVIATATHAVIVAPRLTAVGLTFTPSSPEVGFPVSFNATPTGGIEPYTYAWKFGDSSPDGSGNITTHTYTASGTRTVTVTVTDGNGLTATVSRSIVVVPHLSVDFVFNPSKPEGNQTITMTSSATGGVGTIAYSWSFGDGSPPGTGNPAIYVYANSGGNFTVTLIAIDGNNVTATASHIVVVAPRLSISEFTFVPFLPEGGQTITFTGSQTGGVGPYSYNWNFGDSKTGTGNPASHTYPNSAGNFSVTLTVTDANGVAAMASRDMVVASRLGVDFAFGPAAPEGGQTVTFTANSTGGVGGVGYTWNFGEGTGTGSGESSSHVFADVGGSFAVVVTATDENGVTASATRAFVVAPRLGVVSITGSPNPSEVGIPVNFSVTITGGVGNMTFSWDFDDSSSAMFGNPASHTYTTSGTRTVIVTVTDGNGVTATRTVSEVVNSRLALAPTASPNPVTVGRVISFNAGASGGVSPITCTWTFGDGGTATGCSATHTYSRAGTFVVSVTATDPNNFDANATVSERVNPPPQVSATASPRTTNVGVAVSFFATASEGTGSFLFVWDFGDGSPPGSGNSASHVYARAGAFVVFVTATDSTGVSASSTVSVVVNSPPAMDFAFSPASPAAGSPMTFTAATSGGTGPFTFSWDLGDGSTASGNPVTHTYTSLGAFTITLTKSDSHGATATITHSINLVAWNKPPVITALPTSQQTEVGQPFTFVVAASDPEGSPVSIAVEGLPPGASFDPETGQFSWTPTADQTGSYFITFTATDKGAAATSQSMAIEVEPSPSQACLICMTVLGLRLDDAVVAGLAFFGLMAILAGLVIVRNRRTKDH